MGLLQPALLALGLAVAVPLILHLFHRHHGPRVVFPALRYLRRAERESARRVRLRQILLLLLRVAAVLLIAFAAARPFLRTGGMSHEPAAVVLILDNSMSSGAVLDDERVLDVLKARALESLAQAEPEDRFWLLRAGSPDEPAYPGDAAEMAARVRATEPTAAGADISAALARAQSILAAGAAGRAREIHLLSDMQATGLPARVAAGDATVLIAWRMGRNVPANRSVTNVTVGGGIAPGANERSTVSATVAGTAGDTVNVRLMIGERLAAAGRTVTGGTAILNLPARPGGLLTGHVEIDADAVRADNRRYFATTVTPPPTVAVSGRLPFVEEALAALESAGRIRRTAGADADVVIASGGISSGGRGSGGTAVVLPPESPLEVEALNRRLAVAGIPWSYALQSTPGDARFRMMDSTDAVLQTLESARLRNVYALRPGARSAGDTALLRLVDGTPWAVRGKRAGGTYILLASPLSESASSIPTSAAMLPLLDRIIRTWASSGSATEEAAPGAALTLPAGVTAILRPDSVQEPVTGRYQVPPIAGIYEIIAGARTIGAFAVNPPASDSDLSRLSDAGLEALLTGWPVETANSQAEWERDIFRQRLGRELWRPLLFALLLLLAIEGVVAATGGFRRRTAAAAGSGPAPGHETATRTDGIERETV